MLNAMIEVNFLVKNNVDVTAMGFGLAVSKRIVEAHRGKILVEDTVGRESTFTVTIPIDSQKEGGERVWVNMPESLLSTTTKA
jgi:signal transduction histidine kinase